MKGVHVKYKDHARKPEPQRLDPIRSWATLFTAPRATSAGTATSSNSAPSLSDVVSRSVDLGYRVIDDYIQQGEKAARRMSERSVTPQTMIGDAQDVAARMAQHASGLAAVWLEFLQLVAATSGMPLMGNPWEAFAATAAGAAPRPAPSTDEGNARRSGADAGEPTRLRIEVVSSRPTEVALDLQPSATGRALIVHDLRAVAPDTPRIADVTFQPGAGETPACLRICVPPEQPAGVYSGLIIDEQSSRPVGSVSVSLGADPHARK